MKGRVLVIAGSDPSGGAGVQADIKTITALGGYAATAITAITVQNTRGVTAVAPTPPSIIREQIVAVLDDVGADVVKIGMIGEKDAAETIATTLATRASGLPLVLDPVLVATSGDALAGEGVAGVIRRTLAPLALLMTPNTDELRALSGMPAGGPAEALAAARAILADAGPEAVLAKGGHLAGDDVVDLLVRRDGAVREFRNPRIATRAGHGTGCTLASAVATGLGQGLTLEDAVARAIAYVRAALAAAPGLGAGSGPLDHTVWNGAPEPRA